jgi:hypothetical protein
VAVTDNTGKTGQVSRNVVVYDPSAGFVTGSGWIQSPAGAFKTDPTVVGRATFGFVSKYQKGAKVPTGNTEFHFQSANLDFHSDSYDWLVVGGARGQFKGTGMLNNSGGYQFLLTAVDGALLAGGTAPDRFGSRSGITTPSSSRTSSCTTTSRLEHRGHHVGRNGHRRRQHRDSRVQ